MPQPTDNNNNSGSNISNYRRHNAMDHKLNESLERSHITTGNNTNNNISLMMGEVEIQGNANTFETNRRQQECSSTLIENILGSNDSESCVSLKGVPEISKIMVNSNLNSLPSESFDELQKRYSIDCSNRYSDFAGNKNQTVQRSLKIEDERQNNQFLQNINQNTINKSSVSLLLRNDETSTLTVIKDECCNNSAEKQGRNGKTESINSSKSKITTGMEEGALPSVTVKEHLDCLRRLQKCSSGQGISVMDHNQSTAKYCVLDEMHPHIEI